jgi:phage terminase small subunit
MARKKDNFNDYADFLKKVGMSQLDNVDVTHDGYPLNVKEAKFISLFVANGDVNKSLREANLTMKNIAGKDYITDEITYRLDMLKKETIADADEIMQYFTSVMRGEIKDQFGLDAPLSERTSAARELARRIVDVENDVDTTVPEIKVTLNWDGIARKDA